MGCEKFLQTTELMGSEKYGHLIVVPHNEWIERGCLYCGVRYLGCGMVGIPFTGDYYPNTTEFSDKAYRIRVERRVLYSLPFARRM